MTPFAYYCDEVNANGELIDREYNVINQFNGGRFGKPLYTAPVSIALQSETDSSSSSMRTTVRAKDLTDYEIEAAVLSVNTTMEAWITYRAVIAADREKNK